MNIAALASLLAVSSLLVPAGTWTDHFNNANLSPSWLMDRDAFWPTNGLIEGQSAFPIASPLKIIEIAIDSSDCDVGCWINVVTPNNRVCTKGALVLRHSGNEGYVFALHEPTQTIEVYRLSDGEMLLKRNASIELKKWYYARAELRGPIMTFSVDNQLVGTITDSRQTNGAVGIAVQDAESALFDDFVVGGPGVIGNVDGIARPEISLARTKTNVVVRFHGEPGYDYSVQASRTPGRHDWTTLQNFRAKLLPIDAEVLDSATDSARFYRVEKADCLCD